ncbi:hypothetical protein LTR09_011245 [Extremus antarcticus]|uniref:Uncharacterized protein n=1 Tax=Extremus antarcticus TaxID=702011 RepID=A0AAJ0G4L7_9PEZI|nr:hypothetical protein LTR09_011245 [Extremus antarcticus]
MDNLLQYAYIARLDDTLFCPSNTPPIDPRFILPGPAPGPHQLEPHSANTDIILDNEPGGVLLDAPDVIEGTGDQYTHELSLEQPHALQPDHPVDGPLRSRSTYSICSGLDAPSQRVDEGTDDVTRIEQQEEPTVALLPLQGGERDVPFPTESTTHGPLRSWGTLDSLLHSAIPPLSSYTVDHGTAVVVDDHSSSYDFSEFLEKWHRRDAQAPASVDTLQPYSAVTEQCQDVARSDMEENNVDMQGLQWHIPDRSTALNTRCSRHPTSTKHAIPYSNHSAPRVKSADSEAYYRFRRFSPVHQAQISHHQLRNVLASTSRSDVLYAAGDKVYQTSLATPSTLDTVIDLSVPTSCASGFKITCLATSPTAHTDNIVVAGGFNGEYAMLDLNSCTGGLTEGFVSHAYNSVVTHVSTTHERRSGLLEAAFCSNDRSLRIMDVGTARFTQVHQYDHAVNCSAVSTCSRLRGVVGDSDDALITDADRGEVLVTLRSHTDHIFACAWSPDGRMVATGAEDGRINIWDARNWRYPLATRTCMMSSPRSLHFTDDGFLVAAEDEDVVCVYEPQNFALRQSVRFFGSVSGVTLLDGGAEMVVANGDRTVGGLLSFQRASQGLAGGSHGQRTLDNNNNVEQAGGGDFRRRRRRGCHSWTGEFDVLV